jgi:hypothetical protein
MRFLFLQCHGTELPSVFNRTAFQDYVVHFVTGLNPNTGSTLQNWPPYNKITKQMLTLTDSGPSSTLTIDNYRVNQFNVVNAASEKFPQ